jgi:hypothetical protein
MTDRGFENELERLFDAAPALADEAAFASAVALRLRWRRLSRPIALGAAGVVGAVVALSLLGDRGSELATMLDGGIVQFGPYGLPAVVALSLAAAALVALRQVEF